MDAQVSSKVFLALVMLTGNTEEDRKALIAMLGKLYISTNNSIEKLQSTTELVVEAIDEGKVAQEAPSRNALKRLHSALSKALGDTERFKPISRDLMMPGGDGGLTTVEEQIIEGSVVANEEDIEMGRHGDEGGTEVQDSLEELLEGEDDDL